VQSARAVLDIVWVVIGNRRGVAVLAGQEDAADFCELTQAETEGPGGLRIETVPGFDSCGGTHQWLSRSDSAGI
jgi:hypothetical protein